MDIASDQISRSPEPFGLAQDKLREGVAIRHAVALRGTFASLSIDSAETIYEIPRVALNDPSIRLRAGLLGQIASAPKTRGLAMTGEGGGRQV